MSVWVRKLSAMHIGQYLTDGKKLFEVYDISEDWIFLEDCQTLVIGTVARAQAERLRVVSPEPARIVSSS